VVQALVGVALDPQDVLLVGDGYSPIRVAKALAVGADDVGLVFGFHLSF